MNTYEAKNSAQSYFTDATHASTSTSCGAGDPEPKQPDQPSACGAGDPEPKQPEQPSACGASCGAGDK